MTNQIEKIRARIYVKGKDNFFVFPKTLESAYKMINNNELYIRSRIEVSNLEIITFTNSKDYIEITYR